jgi:hypothetical protein
VKKNHEQILRRYSISDLSFNLPQGTQALFFLAGYPLGEVLILPIAIVLIFILHIAEFFELRRSWGNDMQCTRDLCIAFSRQFVKRLRACFKS